ncbi:MAG: RHS repeat-associated core domain-containing protein [Draconibacterium sp.]
MVVQARHYYSFGMEMSQLNNGTTINKYQYNGKEIQDDFGLYWYDYGARFYDPMIGRWHTQDPLAEDYYSLSPYNYVANNPMIYIDPTGMALDNYSVDEQGNVKLEEETKDKFDMLYTKSDWKAGNKDNGLKVNDKSILPDLADNRTGYNGNYAISTNKDESFNVFSFMANNTNVEWGIDGYRTSGDNEYVIRTSHNPEAVTLSTTLSQYDEFDQIFSIHSHPGNATWEGTKGGSTGDQNLIINQHNRFKSEGMQGVNAWFKKDGSWTVLPKTYVYHKQSKTLYNYTPWKSSVFIRKINKANDMYRNLGF